MNNKSVFKISQIAFLALYLILPLAFSFYFESVFETTKWIFLYLGSIILSILLFMGNSILIPHMDKKTSLLLLVTVITFFLSMVFNQPGYYTRQIQDLFVAIVVFITTFNLYQKSKESFFRAIYQTNYFVTLCFLAQFLWHLVFNDIRMDDYISFMGGRNFTAQWIGFSVIIQFSSLLWHKKKALKFVLPVLIFSIVYLIFLATRSVCLSLILLTMTVLLSKRSYRSPMLKKTLGICLFSVAIFFLLNIVLKDGPKSDHPTDYNLFTRFYKYGKYQNRVALYYNTFQMIKDNPVFGIGPDRYRFKYPPYHNLYKNIRTIKDKNYYFKSPHSGIMEALVESGIYYFLSISLLIFTIFFSFYKKTKDSPIDNSLLPFYLLLYLIFESFFNFPLELCVFYFYFFIFLGCLSAEIWPSNHIRLKIVKKTLLLVPLTLFTWKVILFINAEYVFLNLAHERIEAEFACKTYPQNWRNCNALAAHRIINKRFVSAEIILGNILKIDPYNLTVVSNLIKSKVDQKNMFEACIIHEAYSDEFLPIAVDYNSDHALRAYCKDYF